MSDSVFIEKNYEFTCILNYYAKALIHGCTIGKYLLKKGYKKIAIYGMSFLGERLLEDVMQNGIFVEYGVDIRADQLDVSIPMFLPNDELPKVDVYIITTIGDVTGICNSLPGEVLEFKTIVYSLI